ncbi:MAG: septation protein A [Alphaproteobacteria bacterium]
MPKPDKPPVWVKPTADYGPLIVFFIAYVRFDLMVATAALMAATVVALALSLFFERRIPMMPVITATIVGIFGGLTLWLDDEMFIKLKPTIIQGLISAVLLVGLMFGKPLLRPVMGTTWPMDDVGWRRLTFRFGCFFAVMAVVNEIVWRTQSTDTWVAFKVFGLMGMTFVFGLFQMPLLNRHHIPDAKQASEPTD